MKSNKSFKSRIKVTKNGKTIARTPGLNHFNAKASRSEKLNKKRGQKLSFGKKVKQRFIDTIN